VPLTNREPLYVFAVNDDEQPYDRRSKYIC
jgi:hypothetical protein